ncbi:facilitated trehalose transporter Tret1-like [Diabrotica undecimpunctata]|uniref:facilitated trehalose transporter Tret1-like n=1 Tax=Diabrotica undecimpunctata TaxID=50387 RepID=UPI003B63C6C0
MTDNQISKSDNCENCILEDINTCSDNNDVKVARKSDTFFLYFTALTGSLPWFVGGMSIVWASPAITKLQLNDTEVNPIGRPIKPIEVSALLVSQAIGGIIGTLLLPKLADIYGRKRSLQILSFVMILSTSGVAFSTYVGFIVFCAAITVVAFCGIWAICPIYITEICEDHNRAKFSCFMAALIPVGELFCYIIGSLFSYKTYTMVMTLPLFLHLVLSLLLPESPIFSLTKNKKTDCLIALRKLRSNKSNEEIKIDFENMCVNLANIETTGGLGVSKLLSTREGRIGLLLSLLPIFIQNLCGVPVLMPLMAPIFNKSGSNLSGNTIAMCVGLVKIITFITASMVVEKLGRKPLLIISSLGTGICMSLLGIFFYLNHISSSFVLQFQWVPLTCILCYFVLYGFGLGPVPYSMISELFPSNLRSAASMIVLTSVGILIAVYLAVFLTLAEAIGIYWCMEMFATMSFIGTVLFYTILPETKGKSTEEIQDMIKNLEILKKRI